jgi:hypothetical protein
VGVGRLDMLTEVTWRGLCWRATNSRWQCRLADVKVNVEVVEVELVVEVEVEEEEEEEEEEKEGLVIATSMTASTVTLCRPQMGSLVEQAVV